MENARFMSFERWINRNWFKLLQGSLTIGGLFLAASAIKRHSLAQEARNLIDVMRAHREIWGRLFSSPELYRIFDANIDISKTTVTNSERLLIRMVIHHAMCGYEAEQRHALVPIEGFREDLKEFFGLPIPKRVWDDVKKYQNRGFVQFVERSF